MIKRRSRSAWWVSVQSAVVLAAAGSLGCTLVASTFEPELVSRTDAGLGPGIELDAGRSIPSGAAGCTGSARVGSLQGDVDPSCSMSIGLIGPEDSGLDPGTAPDTAAPQPSLVLAPCTGELGPFGAPEQLTGIDFDENVFGPALSADGRQLYFSGYVGGQQQIYTATRTERGAAFSNVVEVDALNSTDADGSPFITRDGRHLYFFSERDPGQGNRDIWVSERSSAEDEFAAPALVRSINSASGELLPWLSPDELTVMFVSSRGGGRGGADLWRATRQSPDADFTAAVAVFELNSTQNEGRVVLSSDGRSAFFTSDRGGAGGASDIWVASRPFNGGPFSALRRLDQLNSTASEVDVILSSDDTEIFFASSRAGQSQLWRAVRACP
jgi:WD40 repeat protein